MKLEEIGFYTLNDERAKNASKESQLMRCELILTGACNFKCPYCRGLKKEINKTKTLEEAKHIVDLWTDNGNNLKNIRFSGGEPTVWEGIVELVEYTKSKGVERIAISTNGSADMDLYRKLVQAGVNDFSISLDACCSAYGDAMAGGIEGAWEKVIANTKEIAKLSYVSIGCVVTEETVGELKETIEFAANLGVQDIRIISSAQYNQLLENAKTVDPEVYKKYPILKYRIENLNNNRNVRGLQEKDSHRCGLVLDDMAIAGDYHFPCIIYMREGGQPIGKVGENMREERYQWAMNHDTHKDPICKGNCLDVCIDYNNKFKNFHE
jgi:molybdenum cofactor biosynthesis enzyme MoaA